MQSAKGRRQRIKPPSSAAAALTSTRQWKRFPATTGGSSSAISLSCIKCAGTCVLWLLLSSSSSPCRMPVSSSAATADMAYDIRVVAGHDIGQAKPLFSHDVSQVMVPSGSGVRLYSTESCSFLRSIDLHDECAERTIVNLQLHPKFPQSHVVCFSDRGEVFIVDLETGSVLFSKDMFAMVSRDASTTHLRFGHVASHSSCKKSRGVITVYFGIVETTKIYCFSVEDPASPRQLKKAKFDHNVHHMNVVWHQSDAPAIMRFSPVGSFLAVVQTSNLYAQSLPYYEKNRKRQVHKINDWTNYMRNIAFTCIACHPTEDIVATGLSDGRIIVWKDFVAQQQPISVTYHWHRERVADLSFSAAGTVLYSGGVETTLLFYQMSDGSLSFRSKLGVPIKMITSDQVNRKIAVQFIDNSFKLISTDLRQDDDISMNLSELSFDVFSQKVDCVCYEPSSNSLVLKGSPGQLQFYSLQSKSKVQELDVVIKNYEYSELENVAQLIITAFDVSPDGVWIASSELWDDGVHFAEERLKFFRRKAEYELSATFHLAHSKAITGMKFSPDGRTLVTMGSDALCWIWQLKSRHVGELEQWTKMKSFQRNSLWQPSRVAFSSDSSLVAVQFAEVITFWAVTSASILTNKSMPDNTSQDQIVAFGFGGGNRSHVFMEARKTSVTVWNFLRQQTELTVTFAETASLLATFLDPESMRIVCMQQNGSVSIIEDLREASMVELPNALKTPVVTTGAFVPASALQPAAAAANQQVLLFFNEARELLSLSPKLEPVSRAAESAELMDTREEAPGLVEFLGQKIFISSQASTADAKKENKKKKEKNTKKKVKHVEIIPEFDSNKLAEDVFLRHSSHTLPSVDLLCKSFMKCLLWREMPVPPSNKRKDAPADAGPPAVEDLDDSSSLASSV